MLRAPNFLLGHCRHYMYSSNLFEILVPPIATRLLVSHSPLSLTIPCEASMDYAWCAIQPKTVFPTLSSPTPPSLSLCPQPNQSRPKLRRSAILNQKP